MDKLNEPSKLIKDFYQDLISKKRNNENNNFLKNRLDRIESLLQQRESEYIKKAKKKTLHSLAPHSVINIPNSNEVVLKSEMESLYTQNLVGKPGSGEAGRNVYEYLKRQSLDNICPYCSINRVKTLDHFLPKAKFPMFAVTPANLIPCCRDCNTEKDDNFSIDADKLFIHPYFEEIDHFIWLRAIVEEEVWPISFKFQVIRHTGDKELLSKRLSHQQDILDLNNTFNDKANRIFRLRVKNIIENYQSGGKDSVEKFLNEAEDSCRSAELNSWEACMYNAILESEWFFDDAIKHLSDNYGHKVRLEFTSYQEQSG